ATFIGLWIFGWDKLSPRVHLLTIWLTAIGGTLSAYFILAANAFMQNPVGFQCSIELAEGADCFASGGRAELTDIMAVLGNQVVVAAFPHTIVTSWMVTAGIIIAVAAWHLSRGQHLESMRTALKFGLWSM